MLTIHRSKGLEFPIVYCPFLWEPGCDRRAPTSRSLPRPDAGDARTIDVGLEGAAFERHAAQHEVEERGEDLRLAYVALTRAQHQAVVWWAGSWDSRRLAARPAAVRPRGRRDDRRRGVEHADRREGRASASRRSRPAPGCIAVERVGARAADVAGRRPAAPPSGSTPRASTAGSTGAGGAPPTATSPPRRTRRGSPASRRSRRRRRARPAPRARRPGRRRRVHEFAAARRMPAGVRVGTFVHRVFEAADFAAPDLGAELAARVAEARRRGGSSRSATRRPWSRVCARRSRRRSGRSLDGSRCATSRGRPARRARLRAAAGRRRHSRPGGSTLGAIAAVLRAHLPAGDPLAGYAERLDDPALRPSVRGYLTGSIDLVLRLPATAASRSSTTRRTGWRRPARR